VEEPILSMQSTNAPIKKTTKGLAPERSQAKKLGQVRPDEKVLLSSPLVVIKDVGVTKTPQEREGGTQRCRTMPKVKGEPGSHATGRKKAQKGEDKQKRGPRGDVQGQKKGKEEGKGVEARAP